MYLYLKHRVIEHILPTVLYTPKQRKVTKTM